MFGRMVCVFVCALVCKCVLLCEYVFACVHVPCLMFSLLTVCVSVRASITYTQRRAQCAIPAAVRSPEPREHVRVFSCLRSLACNAWVRACSMYFYILTSCAFAHT